MVSEKEIQITDQDVLTVDAIAGTLRRLRNSEVSHAETIATVIRSLKLAMTKMEEDRVLERLVTGLDRTEGK
jgi:hypothetical protein